jgi:cytochrome P450
MLCRMEPTAVDPGPIGVQDAITALMSPAGRADPYRYYDVLRAQAPILPVGNYVLLTRYADCDRVLRDPNFAVEHAGYLDQSFPGWREHSSVVLLRASMLFTPAPAHEPMRRLAAHAFTARRVAGLRGAVEQLAGEVTDRMAELGGGGAPVDFMAEFAYPLPITVAGELLGVPEPDRGWLRTQVSDLSRALEALPDEQELRLADAAADELREYMAKLAADRRRSPQDDLVSALVSGSSDARLAEDELIANLVLLLAAGFETTTNLLGNGFAALLERPDEMARLRAEPGLTPDYVQEMLRYDTPVHVTSRWADEETEIAGVPIPQHREAILLLGAACRDPERFTDPDRFIPDRPDNQPLSFGGGAHFCLGAGLARLQAQVAFPLLLSRFTTLEPAGPPTRRDRLTLNGYATLPITLN